MEDLKTRMVRFDEMKKDCERFEAQVAALQAELASVCLSALSVYSQPQYKADNYSLNADHRDLILIYPYHHLDNHLLGPYTLYRRTCPMITPIPRIANHDCRQEVKKGMSKRCMDTIMSSRSSLEIIRV